MADPPVPLPADPDVPAPNQPASANPANPAVPVPNQPAQNQPAPIPPVPNQPAPAAPQIIHQPALNWSHFKPGFSGRPEEDVEAHLHLQMIGWKPTIFNKV